MATPKLNIGDKVMYNHTFLKSISADYEIAKMRGVIASYKPIGSNQYVKVNWEDGTQSGALSKNLCLTKFDHTT